ncbi:putative serine/threonine protein kinase [Blattamonas nauphoetae]|uniref:non-specific serine/threonine protein kinase n=1 Tax=Blattamonas nauphoetae TaxID=2049346 RepID=A0ABQ9X8W7_9EUKA|nr:putative serine/threonine protein kinase [Blattamonas nauphoetae]
MSTTIPNDYTRLRQLGQGTFGKTYLAINTQSNKLVVLKKIKLDGSLAEDYVRNEIASMVQLKGDNLVEFLGDFGDTRVHWIVQEFCEGGSLRNFLDDLVEKGGRVSEDDLWDLSIGLFRAVTTMHSQSILHRDIKPDNILLTRKGVLKLADLGSSKMMTQLLTASHTQTGTYPYLSPEQLSSQPASPASDVWSCGVVLAELSLGTLPFNASTLPAYLVAVLQGEPAPLNPSEFSEEWRNLIGQLLTKNPDQRLTAEQALRISESEVQKRGKGLPTVPGQIQGGLRTFCEEHAQKEHAHLVDLTSEIETKKTKLEAKMRQLEGMTKYGEEQEKARLQKENEARKIVLEQEIALISTELAQKEEEEKKRAAAAQAEITTVRTQLEAKQHDLAKILLALGGSRFESHPITILGTRPEKGALWVSIPRSVKVTSGPNDSLATIMKISEDGYVNLIIGSEMKTGIARMSFKLGTNKGILHAGVVRTEGLNELGAAVGMSKNEWGFLVTLPDGLHASSSVNMSNAPATYGSTVTLEFNASEGLLTLFLDKRQQKTCYGGLNGTFHFMISMFFKDDFINQLQFGYYDLAFAKPIPGQKIVRFD